MKKNHLYLLIMLLGGLLSSCINKKTDPTIRQLLRAQIWKVQKVVITSNGQTATVFDNGTTITDDYSKTRLSFTTDTDYSYTDQSASTTTGTWTLATNNGSVSFAGGGLDKQTFILVNVKSNIATITWDRSNTAKNIIQSLTIDFIPVQ
jgi:hypothetical protein